jgi:hypothetical protein
MITVTGEIPDPVRALREFRRVLYYTLILGRPGKGGGTI